MATGTGKTLTAAAVIKLFLRTGNASRVLFLVDRLELEDQAILCTDGASVYRRIAKATGITLQSIPKKEKAGVYHIQNVNAYDSHLKRWIRFFNGVATRYLPNYIGWFRFMERTDDGEGCLLLEAALAAE